MRRAALYTHQGRTMTLAAWADHTGVKYNTLAQRLKRGWTFAEAIEHPPLRGLSRQALKDGAAQEFRRRRFARVIDRFLDGKAAEGDEAFLWSDEFQRMAEEAGLDVHDLRDRLKNLAVLAGE